MRILTVYHGDSCIDGFTSAWLSTIAAEQAGYKRPHLYPLTYANEQEQDLQQHIVDQVIRMQDYDAIYVLDISLSLQCLETLTKTTNATIVMLDHHKTAFDRYAPNEMRTPNEKVNVRLHNGQVNIALNNGMSGAGMSFMYFFPNLLVPLLVQHVQDWDLWQFKLENTRAINCYLREQAQTITDWSDINATLSHKSGYKEIVEFGKYLLKKHKEKVMAIAEQSEFITLRRGSPVTGLMVRCSYEYASDVGHELAKRSGLFGLTYFSKGEGMLQVSLRSEGDCDVEVIAKRFGGGGHKNAAGFIIDAESFFSPDAEDAGE